MKVLGKVVLHIPAREGNKRVPRKNMRNMNGKPMISYAIEASLKSKITSELYVNTDSEEIIEYVQKEYADMQTYKRNQELANDNASSEDFNYDIIKKLDVDTLIMINPVCPLIEASDIIEALKEYKKSECDTLISTTSTQMQTFCEEVPVNINVDEPLAASQKNKRIYILNWAITIWDAKKFMRRFEENGYASLGDNRYFFDIDAQKATKVSEEKDFNFAQVLLQTREEK